MSTFLVDTNVAMALFDEKSPYRDTACAFFAERRDSTVFVPAIAWGEFRYGCLLHPGVDSTRRRAIEKRMDLHEVCAIDKHTSHYYSKIRAQIFQKYGERDKKGKVKQKRPESLIDRTTGKSLGIQENDLWIVALAAERGCEFVTADRMHRIREVVRKECPDLKWWDLSAHRN